MNCAREWSIIVTLFAFILTKRSRLKEEEITWIMVIKRQTLRKPCFYSLSKWKRNRFRRRCFRTAPKNWHPTFWKNGGLPKPCFCFLLTRILPDRFRLSSFWEYTYLTNRTKSKRKSFHKFSTIGCLITVAI